MLESFHPGEAWSYRSNMGKSILTGGPVSVLCSLIQICFLIILPVQIAGQRFELWRGSSSTEGLLRLSRGGKHSLVCSKSLAFTRKEADVLCQGLGLPRGHSVITPYENYLTGNESFWEFETVAINFRCQGSETSFEQCVNFTTVAEPKNETCFRGISVLCSNTAPRYERTVEDFRLRVNMVSSWSTVCADGLSVNDAVVACKTLQEPWLDARPLKLINNSPTGWKLRDLRCTGSEDSLEDCSSVVWGDTQCKSGRDVGVFCGDVSDYKFRLMNGSSLSAGRLEVHYKERWGTVCGKGGFGKQAARVACKSLGFEYSNARLVPITQFGTGAGVIWMANVSCRGTEANLRDCDSAFDGNPVKLPCTHFDDVAISCESYRVNSQGSLRVSFEGRWADVYNGSFDMKTATVACRALGMPRSGANFMTRELPASPDQILDVKSCLGSEENFFDCQPEWVNPEELRAKGIGVGGINLMCQSADGSGIKFRHPGEDMMGLYEVYNGSHWGTICGNGLDVVEARIACRNLRLSSSFAAVLPPSYTEKGNGSVLLDGVTCQGQESSLSQCDHNPWGVISCDTAHRDDLNIYCGKPENNYQVRLVGGSEKAGRVEVKIYGEWGTVCSDGFDKNAAKVVCRQLNQSISEARTVSIFPEGEGRIWLHKVNCTGEEEDIRNCKHGPLIGQKECTHDDDIGVVCSGSVVKPVVRVSRGEIAGIVIAVLLLFAILIAALFVGIRRWSAARRDLRSNLLKTATSNTGAGSGGRAAYSHDNGVVNVAFNESPNGSLSRAGDPNGYTRTSKAYEDHGYDNNQEYKKGAEYHDEDNLRPPAYHTLDSPRGDFRTGYANYPMKYGAQPSPHDPVVSQRIPGTDERSPRTPKYYNDEEQFGFRSGYRDGPSSGAGYRDGPSPGAGYRDGPSPDVGTRTIHPQGRVMGRQAGPPMGTRAVGQEHGPGFSPRDADYPAENIATPGYRGPRSDYSTRPQPSPTGPQDVTPAYGQLDIPEGTSV